MLLQKLKEYSERLALPPPLYNLAPVRYIVELAPDGRFLGLTDTADASSRVTRRGQPRLVPQVQRSSGIRPLLLSDKADYVLGYAGDGDKPERVAACHEAFVELTEACAASTKEPSVAAVLHFLQASPMGQLTVPQGFDPSGTITFRVDGVFPVDLPSVRAFWASRNDPSLAGAPIMQCVVCGQQRPVLERLQAKIKGVPGGQTSGTSIISANAEAFESYGLEASLIAPTCADCAERFTKAANDLLAGPTSVLRLNNMAFLFWTKEDVGFNIAPILSDPQNEDIDALINSVGGDTKKALASTPQTTDVQAHLDSPRSGKPMPDLDDTPFYATALSGSGGRAVVRDWLDTTVREVKESLAKWFIAQRIVDINGQREPVAYLSHRALAFATVREAKDLPVTTPRTLLRCALTGAPLPMDILYQAVRRNRAERDVTRPRAALIKLVLMTQPNVTYKEQDMVTLQMNHPEPAYQWGRAFAVIEQAQRAPARPGQQREINASVVDRFYGTASSTPGTVFGLLIRNAQNHLGRIQSTNPRAHNAIQRKLEEVLSLISPQDLAKPFTLKEQGLFALGYYHQRGYDRAQAREAAERRRQGLAVDPAIPEALDENESSEG